MVDTVLHVGSGFYWEGLKLALNELLYEYAAVVLGSYAVNFYFYWSL